MRHPRFEEAAVLLVPLMIGLAACGERTTPQSAPAPPVAESATKPTQDAKRAADVRFVPARREVRRQCRATARRLRFPVLCPGLLPEHSEATKLGCRGRAQADDLIGTGCLGFSRWQFASIDTDTDHLVLQAAPIRMRARDFLFYPDRPTPPPLRRLRTQRVGDYTATVYAVGDWQGAAFSRHTVLIWRTGRHTYGFGFHGRGHRADALNRFLIKHLRLVDPSGRARLLL